MLTRFVKLPPLHTRTLALKASAHPLILVGLISAACALPSTSWAQDALGMVRFVVTRGDTLGQISKQVLLKPEHWREVAKLNQLSNPNRIEPGQVLVIPAKMMQPGGATPAQLLAARGQVQVDGQAVQSGWSLALGQVLSTGALSTAQVKLSDGSVVNLSPNTQITITEGHSYPVSTQPEADNVFISALRLLQGSVEILATKVLRAQPLTVTTPTAVIGVRGTTYRVHSDNSTYPTRAEVLEGLVAVNAGAGEAEVGGLQGAALQTKKTPVVRPLPPAPDLSQMAAQWTPAAGQTAPTWSTQNWNTPNPSVRSYNITFSKDAQAQDIVVEATVPLGQNYALPPSLKPGVWYAQVTAVDDLGLRSPSRSHRFELQAQAATPVPAPVSAPAAPPSWELRPAPPSSGVLCRNDWSSQISPQCR